MANPPFNVDKVDKDKLAGDRRFPFGLPKPDNANYLWIQLFYAALSDSGQAGFVMANSAAVLLLERELEFLANVVRIEARRSKTTEGSEALLKSDSRTTLMSTYRVSARWSPAPRLRLRVGA